MFYLREISYTFDINEYNFIKSIPSDENGFTNPFFNSSIEEFIEKALPYYKNMHNGINLPEGYVPETFLLLINDEEIIGLLRIRHYMTEELKKNSGHIIFYIKPEFRGKGFGKALMRLAITYAYQYVKDEDIFLRTLTSNEPSINILLANGGQIDYKDEEYTYFRIEKKPVSQEFAMQIALDEAYNGIGIGDGGPFGRRLSRRFRIILSFVTKDHQRERPSGEKSLETSGFFAILSISS